MNDAGDLLVVTGWGRIYRYQGVRAATRLW